MLWLQLVSISKYAFYNKNVACSTEKYGETIKKFLSNIMLCKESCDTRRLLNNTPEYKQTMVIPLCPLTSDSTSFDGIFLEVAIFQ